MIKEHLLPIKSWFSSWKAPETMKSQMDTSVQSSSFTIPIQPHASSKHFVPVHFSIQPKKADKIGRHIVQALGGFNNIESYREIPNSRRIRLTLVNPGLVDNAMLEEADVRMFIRIGKRIVHIIP